MILSFSAGKRRVHTGAVDSSLLGGVVTTRQPFIVWLSLSAVKKQSCSVSSERMVDTSDDEGQLITCDLCEGEGENKFTRGGGIYPTPLTINAPCKIYHFFHYKYNTFESLVSISSILEWVWSCTGSRSVCRMCGRQVGLGEVPLPVIGLKPQSIWPLSHTLN